MSGIRLSKPASVRGRVDRSSPALMGVMLLLVLLFTVTVTPRASAQVFNPDVHGLGLGMNDYMRGVPGGGQPGGPAYDFQMAQYEVTNAQFASFLNDAQLDDGATGRGSNMYFEADGTVRTSPGGPQMFRPPGSKIVYNSAAPIGQRYTPSMPTSGLNYSSHPVVRVTWYGSLKFSNWLTIDQGVGEGERAYAEGPTEGDWHPMSISAADWQTRDLNVAERQDLVDNYRGFRLPMDDHSSTASAFNEWYKAAAWDPAAQTNRQFGFGRDVIDQFDANGNGLADGAKWGEPDNPFPSTTPVGFFDGSLQLRSEWNWPADWNMENPSPGFNANEFQTRVNANAFGIYDLSGNVWEWAQDKAMDGFIGGVIRGGGYGSEWFDLTNDYRLSINQSSTSIFHGIRIIQTPEPGSALMLIFSGMLVLATRRR